VVVVNEIFMKWSLKNPEKKGNKHTYKETNKLVGVSFIERLNGESDFFMSVVIVNKFLVSSVVSEKLLYSHEQENMSVIVDEIDNSHWLFHVKDVLLHWKSI